MDRHATAREEELIYDAGYAEKVLTAFINNGQLVTIPAKLKKQRVVLDYIVQRFEPGRGYHELDVNALLKPLHPDVATLRRLLITEKLMTRENSIYVRVTSELAPDEAS
jgi:hypothetical protein